MEEAWNIKIGYVRLSPPCRYSSRISVVAVDFYDVVQQYNTKSKQSIPDHAIQQIFLNLKQIHQLSENILQELQQRMDTWYVMQVT